MRRQSFTKLLVVVMACLTWATSMAQTAERRLAVGLHFGQREYHGDLGYWSFLNDQVFHPTGGISLNYYVSPSLDAMVNANWGQIGYLSKKGEFQTYSFGGHIADYFVGGKYKFSNGKLLKEDTKIRPYVFMGLGGFNYFIKTNFGFHLYDGNYVNKQVETAYKFNWPMGAGFDYPINDNLSAYGQITYNYTMSDSWDGIHRAAKWSDNDQFLYYAAGIKYNLPFGDAAAGARPKKMKDDDNDGVANKYDKCKTTRPGYAVDSVGCDLDSDKDSIVDTEDKCPETPGIRQFEGCPDTDGDGIQDALDKCPTEAGIVQFEGCPDTDGDGIQNSLDKCPNEAGIAAKQGCPFVDTDKDGIDDAEDRCPTVAGIAANRGCPEIKAEVMKKVAVAAKGVFFESGKDVIKKESFDDLNVLAAILNADKELKVSIEGHTDDVGDPEKNMQLSQRRTEAVKKYLESKGVDPSRMTATGMGSTKPVADNKTPKGRAQNRRVEFKLDY
jgi:OOP family OmpA-OmpF porin